MRDELVGGTGMRKLCNEKLFNEKLFAKYYYGDEFKEDEMGRACSTLVENKRNTRMNFLEKPQGKRTRKIWTQMGGLSKFILEK
jgi:hypothetical protein